MTLVISVYIIAKEFIQYKESNEDIKNLIEDTMIQKDNEQKIDWDKLEERNRDIIGWIKISNTNINYPILRDSYNLKYLKCSFDGEYNKNGSIFTLNSRAFQDDETIIYGHNNNNGIMFSELSKYMNEEFFTQNRNFTIYTREQDYNATVFSCYSIGENEEQNNIENLDFHQKIEYYKNVSKFINNIGEIKKIVKLSSCSYLNNHTNPTNQRYYIVAKIEKDK